jgi:hypothetical protein
VEEEVDTDLVVEVEEVEEVKEVEEEEEEDQEEVVEEEVNMQVLLVLLAA